MAKKKWIWRKTCRKGNEGREVKLTSGIALWSVLLHGDMCVQVVQGSVALFAVSPVADIQTLNLVKSAARPFFRVHPRDWNKGVDFVSSLAVINTVKACIGEPSSSLRLLLRCSNLLKGRRIRSIVGGHLRGMGLRRRLESHGIHITNQRRRTDHSMDWDCIGTNHATVSKRTANQRAGSRVLGAGQAVHHQARASIDRGHKGVCDAPAVGLVNRNVWAHGRCTGQGNLWIVVGGDRAIDTRGRGLRPRARWAVVDPLQCLGQWRKVMMCRRIQGAMTSMRVL